MIDGYSLPYVFNCWFQCNIGYAGNGQVCGTDKDVDSWPDAKIECLDLKCQAVSYLRNNTCASCKSLQSVVSFIAR